MQGRTLSVFGILLTLGSASVSIGTAASIAQKQASASKAWLEQAPIVKLLPLPAEKTHEARRVPRLIAKQTTWRPIAANARSSTASAPMPAKRAYLAAVDQPDIEERHKIIATEVLGLMPETCLQQIQHFYVRYSKPERRGLAGKSTIIMDGTLSDVEFRAVLIHEAMGHVFDLGCLQGTAASGKSAFLDGTDPVFNDDPSLAFYRISWADAQSKKPISRLEDFVTGYAETDPFEDLAESAIYFILQNRSFVERARTNRTLAVKLKWFETFLPMAPMANDSIAAAWDGSIPWDATKLKYTWNRQVVAKQ